MPPLTPANLAIAIQTVTSIHITRTEAQSILDHLERQGRLRDWSTALPSWAARYPVED